MVFVTLIYVGVALFQLGAISRQANIAEKSANAAKLSADVAEQALTLENRPWINVPNKGWRWRDGSAPGPDSKIVVDFTIENFGKRPAWITKLFARMETIYIGDRYPDPLDYTETNIEHTYFANEVGQLIPPDREIPRRCVMWNRQFTEDEVKAWHRGEFFIYTYGFVEYKDALKKIRHFPFIAKHRFRNMGSILKALGLNNGQDTLSDVWEITTGPETDIDPAENTNEGQRERQP
jgi:hypothetical protein